MSRSSASPPGCTASAGGTTSTGASRRTSNVAIGAKLTGASWTVLRQCYFFGNPVNLETADGTDTTQTDREIVSVHLDGGQIIGGKINFGGLGQDFTVESAEITGVELAMLTPRAPTLLRDCVESDTTITGETSMLTRWRTSDHGMAIGQTATATTQPVWRYKLGPGDVAHLDIKATAEQTNGQDANAWHYSAAARCAHATLTYDNIATALTVGRTIEGQTSHATGVVAAIPSGTTALLGDVRGTFIDDEQVLETSGSGHVQVNGTLALGAAALLGSSALLFNGYTGGASTWGVGITVAAQEVIVSVVGEASKNISWVVQVDVTSL
jgi:hypothetical protein